MNPLHLAAAVALLAPIPPFPEPKLTSVPPDTRCDWGAIGELRARAPELVLRTDAGPLEIGLGPSVKIAGADGRPLASAAELRAGQTVRVYYRVDHGAKALEIDVVP